MLCEYCFDTLAYYYEEEEMENYWDYWDGVYQDNCCDRCGGELYEADNE